MCRMLIRRVSTFILITLLASQQAIAWYPRLESDSYLDGTSLPQLVGKNRPYYIGPGEDLIQLAWRGGVGYKALVKANPEVDPWLPKTGEQITLPYAMIVPNNLQTGITINLAELRLYYVWEENGRRRLRAYPISVGAEGLQTPEGEFKVKNMVENPTWTAPASIREERPDGPHSIPPGPDNPLGDHWIGLSIPGYGIHGTNKPLGVGRRVSHWRWSSGQPRVHPSLPRGCPGSFFTGQGRHTGSYHLSADQNGRSRGSPARRMPRRLSTTHPGPIE